MGTSTLRIEGNEKADEFAKAAAEGGSPTDAVADGYRWEASLSHMTRVTTETKARATAQRLRRTRKSVAGRYFHLLSGTLQSGRISGIISRRSTATNAGGTGKERSIQSAGYGPLRPGGCESDREVMRVETPKGPVGQAPVRGPGHRGGPDEKEVRAHDTPQSGDRPAPKRDRRGPGVGHSPVLCRPDHCRWYDGSPPDRTGVEALGHRLDRQLPFGWRGGGSGVDAVDTRG